MGELIFCGKKVGSGIGGLCEKCDGKCVICDSYVRPCQIVRLSEECHFLGKSGKCIICNSKTVSDAYYCKACVLLEKDRDGCPKIININSSKIDLFYETKSFCIR